VSICGAGKTHLVWETTWYGNQQTLITTLKRPTADGWMLILQFTEDNVMYYLILVLIFKLILKTNITKAITCLIRTFYMRFK